MTCRPIPQAMVRQLTARRLVENSATSPKKKITPAADCYDPQVLDRYLPQVIELSGVIDSSRKARR